MNKRLNKKALKKALSHTIYFYIEFANGTTFKMPVKIKGDNYTPRDQLIHRLAEKEGSITDNQGRTYNFKDMIRYHIEDERTETEK